MAIALALFWLASPAEPQAFTERGYVETGLRVYPQEASGDSGHVISESVLHWESALRWRGWRWNGALGAYFDSHRMAERTLHLSYWDREIRRPAFDLQRFSVSWARGPVTVELGKQFVRWGKTDVLIPTDRFSPRDYVNVLDSEFLAITAARVTVANQNDSLDLVYAPRLTPSRIPLLNQRWVLIPPEAGGVPLVDAGARYPGGGEYGVRWNHLARRLEYSFSMFRGYNHLPLLDVGFLPAPARIVLRRDYPQLQTLGGDAALPLRWFTLKSEAAWFRSGSPASDEYVLYVAQAERQSGEWLFIVGYAGEYTTRNRHALAFDPDRGLAKSVVGRASFTIDTRRSIAFEAVAKQGGRGFYGKFEYSHAVGQHWRLTGRLGIIRGFDDDFLGQYHRNSFSNLIIRYSL